MTFARRTETMVFSAWSQSGKNKTVQIKLYYWKAITKEGNTRSSQKTHIIFRKTLSWSLLSHNAILHN